MYAPFRKGLDKEMGMSGMDAMHPSGKYIYNQLFYLSRFFGGRRLRFGDPYCVFDKIVFVCL